MYWVDTTTGILRRYSFASGLVDCPLFADCGAATAAMGAFSGAGHYSIAITAGGRIYVLDAAAGKIFLVTTP